MTELAGKTAFLTGGTGFVGSHLAERLIAEGVRVRCLVRSDPKWLDGMDVELVRGSLNDPDSLDQGIEGADFVFHLAGRTRGLNWSEFERDNVSGTVNLLESVYRSTSVQRTIVASSLAAVGTSDTDIADESTPLNPVSDYGRSKAIMEERIADFNDRMPLAIVRPPAVYGPRESDILTFFQTVDRGLCPIVGAAGKASLSLVHVNDLIDGILLTALHPDAANRTWFLGGPEQAAWAEIRDAAATSLNRRVLTLRIPRFVLPIVGTVSEIVGRLSGSYPPLNREKAKEILHATLMCDSSAAMRDLGYAPKITPMEGVPSTIDWYKKQGWLATR